MKYRITFHTLYWTVLIQSNGHIQPLQSSAYFKWRNSAQGLVARLEYWNTELVAAKFHSALHASHLNIPQTVEVYLPCYATGSANGYNKTTKVAINSILRHLQHLYIQYRTNLSLQYCKTLYNLVYVYYIVHRITKTVTNIKHYVWFHFNITAKGALDYFG